VDTGRESGLVWTAFSRVGAAVKELLRPANYRRCKEALAAHRNRAVFEVPEILEAILQEAAEAMPQSLPAETPRSSARRRLGRGQKTGTSERTSQ